MALTVPLAVFGPLANGADVRLLARPSGGELSPAGLDEFSRFYYAGWRGSSRREEPYWTFLPLDDAYWGLIKSQVIAKRSMGVVFVSWLALLNVQQLDAIDWRTHHLWSGVLPDPLWLPDPGTLIEPAQVTVGAPARPIGETEIADRLAFSIDSGWQRGAQVYLPPLPALGATPESVLSAAWDRMGKLVAGHSYSTWAEIEAQGFIPQDGPLDLVTGGSLRAGAPHITGTLDLAPTAAWIDHRHREGGIDPAAEVEPSREDISQIADMRYAALRDRILRGDFAVFREITRQNYANSVASVRVLTLAVEALRASRPADAAKAIDVFVAEALEHVQRHSGLPDPRAEIATEAVFDGLVFRLKPETIEALANALFGSGSGLALTDQVSRELASRSKSGGRLDWAPPLTMRAMLGQLGAEQRRDGLRNQLLGVLGAHDLNSVPLVATHLKDAENFTDADTRYRQILDTLPAQSRPGFIERLFPTWAERARRAMAGHEGLEQGLTATLATIVSTREQWKSESGGATQ